MKKGEITLESIIKLLPHLIIAILLVFILASMIYVLVQKEKMPAEQDFERFIAEFNDLLKAREDTLSVGVPLLQQDDFFIVAYPKNDPDLPKICNLNSCVCLYYTPKGSREIVEKCKLYASIGVCVEGECSDKVCFSSRQRISAQKSVIVHRDCNRLSFA